MNGLNRKLFSGNGRHATVAVHGALLVFDLHSYSFIFGHDQIIKQTIEKCITFLLLFHNFIMIACSLAYVK